MLKRRTLLLCIAPLPIIAAVVAVLLVTMSGVLAPPSASAQAETHHSVPRIHLHDGSNSTSTNWSGYANTGGTFTDVKGSWKQPSASCLSGQTAYSSFWVGIDGDTTNTVEQTGTDADCSSGAPQYYAWYEMYPKFPVNLSNPVSPGDSMSAEVSVSSGNFTLTISDSSKGWSYTTHQTSKKAKLGSAEWIAEAPSGSGGVLPLANFGSVSFSNCTANGKSISANPSPDEIVMETSGGVVKAQPSSLGSSGTAFSVSWAHS